MLNAEKYHDVSIKKINKDMLEKAADVADCPLTLSEQGGESSDNEKIVRYSYMQQIHCLLPLD